MLERKKPGMKSVWGMPSSLMYSATAALESKCSTCVSPPLVSFVASGRALQIKWETEAVLQASAMALP